MAKKKGNRILIGLECTETGMRTYVTQKNKVNTMLDDLEAEITYLLLRNYKPKVTVEISPYDLSKGRIIYRY